MTDNELYNYIKSQGYDIEHEMSYLKGRCKFEEWVGYCYKVPEPHPTTQEWKFINHYGANKTPYGFVILSNFYEGHNPKAGNVYKQNVGEFKILIDIDGFIISQKELFS